MTIVLESYQDKNGVTAYIEQKKFCQSFQLKVCTTVNNDIVVPIASRTYLSKQNARRAMKRYMTEPITCTSKH